MKALRAWSANPGKLPGVGDTLAGDDLAAARQEIARLLKVSDVEAGVIRERLARHGAALLPEVYAQLTEAPTDAARERLTTLRYRLVASSALVFDWTGGLERLAAVDAEPRRQAVQELAAGERASAGLKPAVPAGGSLWSDSLRSEQASSEPLSLCDG